MAISKQGVCHARRLVLGAPSIRRLWTLVLWSAQEERCTGGRMEAGPLDLKRLCQLIEDVCHRGPQLVQPCVMYVCDWRQLCLQIVRDCMLRLDEAVRELQRSPRVNVCVKDNHQTVRA